MNIPDILTAVILSFFAVALIAVLLAAIFMPLFGLLRGSVDAARIRKVRGQLNDIDQALAQHNFKEALRLLKQTVFVSTLHSPALIPLLREHHQNILSRCLIIAEELNRRPAKIAEVETLFMQRAELQTLFCRVSESFQSLRSRRERSNKTMPNWGKSDFENRIKQVQKELDLNQVALERELADMFSSLSQPRKEDVTYH